MPSKYQGSYTGAQVDANLAKAASALQPEALNSYRQSSAQDTIDQNLQNQINALKSLGRFLAIWNASTGLPLTNPTTLPYAYKSGDYYRIGGVATGGYIHTVTMSGTTSEEGIYTGTYNVTFSFKNQAATAYTTVADIAQVLGETGATAIGTFVTTTAGALNIVKVIEWIDSESNYVIALLDNTYQKVGLTQTSATLSDTVTGTAGSTNYRPEGTSYTGAASTTVETESIMAGGVYYFDGSQWSLQAGGAEAKIQDIQAEGTSVLNSSTGIANITRTALGLSEVDNTSDANKPISNAAQAVFLTKESIANKVASVSSSSTDNEYPSAKCVYDLFASLVADIEELRGAN